MRRFSNSLSDRFESREEMPSNCVAMDTGVLTAYGWTDLHPKCTCEFLLDYEDDESESAAEESGGRKKKPWRYRWPDEVRDEVLARLLKLNAERAEEERLAGAATAVAPAKLKKARGKKSAAASPQTDLIPPPQGDLFANKNPSA